MTDAERQIERIRTAKKIASRPGDFKVCMGCDSVVAIRVILCPSCHAYRYETDPEFVADHAMATAKKEQETVTREDLIE